MSETVPSASPGRYELFVGSAEGFHPPVMRRVQESNGTQASLCEEPGQANIRLGQRTTSQGGSLARKRYQTGSVFLRGKSPVWIGRYREDVIGTDGRVVRKRRSVVLGTKKKSFQRSDWPSDALNNILRASMPLGTVPAE